MNSSVLLIAIQVPSFCCAMHIFIRFAQRTSPLRRVQNHLLVCLLIVATYTIGFDLPNTQKYFWTGSATIQTSWFCYFWNISFLSTAALSRTLMAFMCIERHFLVFRPQLYHTRRSRLLFHYIPLIFISSIVFMYQFVTNIFVSCPQIFFNYSRFLCGYTCAVLRIEMGTVYSWVYVFISTVIKIVGCVLLPIRFVIQKRQLQRLQWSRTRKMIVQTSIIAGVYTVCWFPFTIVLQLAFNNYLSFSNPDIDRVFAFVSYMTSLLTPFIVLHTIPGWMNLALLERFKRRLFPQRQRAVRPATNSVAQQVNHFAIEERNGNEQ